MYPPELGVRGRELPFAVWGVSGSAPPFRGHRFDRTAYGEHVPVLRKIIRVGSSCYLIHQVEQGVFSLAAADDLFSTEGVGDSDLWGLG